MNGSSTNVVISGEGVTTLSFYATDNAGNTSDVGTHTVKLDKTAPEAFLRFDPARKDFALFGRDATSGTSAGAVSPSFVRRQSTGDKNRRAENRTYDLIDAAGNTLQLVVSVGLTKDDAVAAFQSFQYRGGNVVRPPYNVLFAEWKLKKNAFDELKQTAIVTFPTTEGGRPVEGEGQPDADHDPERHDDRPGHVPDPDGIVERRRLDRDDALARESQRGRLRPAPLRLPRLRKAAKSPKNKAC